jgi:hypothetical protein
MCGGTHGGEEKRILGFDWGYLKEGDRLEDMGIRRRIIFYAILRIWDRRVWTG